MTEVRVEGPVGTEVPTQRLVGGLLGERRSGRVGAVLIEHTGPGHGTAGDGDVGVGEVVRGGPAGVAGVAQDAPDETIDLSVIGDGAAEGDVAAEHSGVRIAGVAEDHSGIVALGAVDATAGEHRQVRANQVAAQRRGVLGVGGDTGRHLIGDDGGVHIVVRDGAPVGFCDEATDFLRRGRFEVRLDHRVAAEGGIRGVDGDAGHEPGAGAVVHSQVRQAQIADSPAGELPDHSPMTAGPFGVAEVADGMPHAVDGAGEGIDHRQRIAPGQIQICGHFDGRGAIAAGIGVDLPNDRVQPISSLNLVGVGAGAGTGHPRESCLRRERLQRHDQRQADQGHEGESSEMADQIDRTDCGFLEHRNNDLSRN